MPLSLFPCGLKNGSSACLLPSLTPRPRLPSPRFCIEADVVLTRPNLAASLSPFPLGLTSLSRLLLLLALADLMRR